MGWRRLLGPLSPPNHVGIHLDGDTLFASMVTPSLLGPRPRDGQSMPLAGRPLEQRLPELLRLCWESAGRPAHVVLGVPGRDVYLETRRLVPGMAPASLRDLAPATELVPATGTGPRPIVQVIRRPDPRSHTSLHCVVACRDKLLERLESILPAWENVSFDLEPAPVGALRYSLHQDRPPDGSVTVRLLAGPAMTAGFLLHGSWPLLMAVAPAHAATDRIRHLLALVVGLTHHARAYLELEPSEVAVQGVDPVQLGELAAPLGTSIRSLPGSIDGTAVASGLALGSCGVEPAPIHLHRHHRERRRASHRSLPWRDVAAGGVALAALVFSMELEARRLERATEAYRLQLPPELARDGRPVSILQSERDALARHWNEWVDFVDRPVSWTRTMAGLAQALPEHIRLIRIEGRNPVFPRTPPDAGRDFAVNIVSPEKHMTLGAILSDPYLKRAFPRIEVNMAVGPDAQAGVTYTLMLTGQDGVAGGQPEAAPRSGATTQPDPGQDQPGPTSTVTGSP